MPLTKQQLWYASADGKAVLALPYKEARKHLASFGIELFYFVSVKEYSVNKGNREATTYYTDDLQDAIGTAYAEYINKE